MDSRDLRPDGGARALDHRQRLRLLAITLWVGFLGGALTLLTAIALLPADGLQGADWGELSIGFLCAWVLAAIPAALALLLTAPRGTGTGGSGG